MPQNTYSHLQSKPSRPTFFLHDQQRLRFFCNLRTGDCASSSLPSPAPADADGGAPSIVVAAAAAIAAAAALMQSTDLRFFDAVVGGVMMRGSCDVDDDVDDEEDEDDDAENAEVDNDDMATSAADGSGGTSDTLGADDSDDAGAKTGVGGDVAAAVDDTISFWWHTLHLLFVAGFPKKPQSQYTVTPVSTGFGDDVLFSMVV